MHTFPPEPTGPPVVAPSRRGPTAAVGTAVSVVRHPDTSLALFISSRDGVQRVAGELDMDSAPTLQGHLELLSAVVPPGTPTVLDLSGLTFIDTAGLSVLLRTQAMLARRGQTLLLKSVPSCLDRLLELTRNENTFAAIP